MTQQNQTIRRDTIKTVNFRGKSVDSDGLPVIVHHDPKADTIGSYIDENNHKQFVVVSNGDTFAVQMYVPRQIDSATLEANREMVALMNHIESIQPCDSHLLAFGDNRSASEIITIAEKPKQDFDYDQFQANWVDPFIAAIMVPMTAQMVVRACLNSVEMVSKIIAVWRA